MVHRIWLLKFLFLIPFFDESSLSGMAGPDFWTGFSVRILRGPDFRSGPWSGFLVRIIRTQRIFSAVRSVVRFSVQIILVRISLVPCFHLELSAKKRSPVLLGPKNDATVNANTKHSLSNPDEQLIHFYSNPNDRKLYHIKVSIDPNSIFISI